MQGIRCLSLSRPIYLLGKWQHGVCQSALVSGCEVLCRHRHDGQPQFMTNQGTEDIERAIGKMPEDQQTRYHLKPNQPPDARILRVAVLGVPNAGKSTLTNQLMRWKVSSVSKKVHTTRKNTRAVFTEGNTQIVFLDTPGILYPGDRRRHNLEASLYHDPAHSMNQADIVGVVVDASNKWTRNYLHKHLLKILHQNQHVPSILLINKVDQVKTKPVLLHMLRRLTNETVDGKHIEFRTQKPRKKKKENVDQFFERLERKTASKFSVKNSDNSRDNFEIQSTDEQQTGYRTSTCLHAELKPNLKTSQNFESKENFCDNSEERLENLTESEFHSDLSNFVCNLNSKDNKASKGKETKTNSQNSTHVFEQNQEEMLEINNRVSEISEIKLNRENQDISCSVKDLTQKEGSHSFKNSTGTDLPTKKLTNTVKEESSNTDTVIKESSKMTSRSRRVGGMEVLTEWKEDSVPVLDFEETSYGWPYFHRVFMISALSGDGVPDVKDYLLENARPGDWDYHSSLVTDQNPMEAARTFVWEKILDYLPEEVPYLLYPEILIWEDDDIGSLNVVMQVEGLRNREMALLLGKGGETIARIAQEAKQEIMNAFRCEVKLKIIARQGQKRS